MQPLRYFFSFFPQFHADPVNDRAWGEGFTDWNLIRDLPDAIRGSFTPSLGYYDPSGPDYLPRLSEQLAAMPLRDPGLMVYHYHFDGQHTLSKFEQQLLAQRGGPTFFFCWANETWSKRWIGRPNDIIIEQQHLLDRSLIGQHANYLARYFDLPNYHRIGGRPVLIIYNPHANPNLPAAVGLYREAFAALGHQPLIGCCIAYPQRPGQVQPYDFGCEFEPRFFFNTRKGTSMLRVASQIKARFPRLFEWLGAQRDRLREQGGNRCFFYAQYLDAVRSGQIEDELRTSAGSLPLMRSTFLSWDNTPRYRHRSTSVSHETLSPQDFGLLGDLRSDEGLPILINSWNEWSEGAALEPGMAPNVWRDAFLSALAQPALKAKVAA